MTRYLLAGLAVGLVLLLIVAGVSLPGTPDPLPASAPSREFSAERALVTLRALAGSPRPPGSPAAVEARSAIVAALEALGVEWREQTATVVSRQNPAVAGTVHNVVARLPGRETGQAVVLVAHYDSVAVSPGAADDASGVAAVLEAARSLEEGPRLRNDVVLLLTDGEEHGLLGAQAYLRDGPWRQAVAVVLNLDSPGSSTPAIMYDTRPGNEGLVRALAEGAPRVATSSLLSEVARRYPIQTDLRPFQAAGVAGMSFASLDGPAYYHTAYDDVAHYDAQALQHLGETVLGLTRYLGERDLEGIARSGQSDVVFFDIAGRVVVYGAGWVVPFLAGAGLISASAIVVAARRRLLRPRGLAMSLLAVPGVLGVALVVMTLVWGMYRTAYAQRTWSDVGMVISDFYRAGLVLLAAAAVIGAYTVVLGRLRAWDLAAAALVWWMVVAVGVGLRVPGASYLLTWPLAAAALGYLAAAVAGDRHDGWPAAALALLGAAPAVVLATGATYLLLASEGLKQAVTVAAVWLVAGLLVIPLDVVRRVFRLWLPAGLAVAGAAALIVVGMAVVDQAEHPRYASIHYRLDATGRTVWQTIDPVDAWTRQFVGESARIAYAASYFPQLGMSSTTEGPAPAVSLAPPRVRVLSDTVDGARRTVRLRLVSTREAPLMSLLVHSVVGRLSATLDGQSLRQRDTAVLDDTSVRWRFDYYALPADGIVVTLRFAAGPPVALRVVDCSYGIPAELAGRYAARPAGLLPGGIGDATLAETTLHLPAVAARTAGE